MSAEQNAQIVRESIEAAVRQDWNRLRSLYAADAILLGTPEPVRGNDAIVKLWQGCHDEVPGITCEIANIIAQGDMVAAEWRVGPEFQGAEVYICRVPDGKIVSNRIYGFSGSWDN